jgi:hypothetical protein
MSVKKEKEKTKQPQPRNSDGTFSSNKGRDYLHTQAYTQTKPKQKQKPQQKPKVKEKEKEKEKPKTKGKKSNYRILDFIGRLSILGHTGTGKLRYGLTIPMDTKDTQGGSSVADLYGQQVHVRIETWEGRPEIQERDQDDRKELRLMTVTV